MRVLLLHNPRAGDGDSGRRELLQLLAEHGCEARYRSTKKPGWKRALQRPGELIVVAGGDGTIAKVLRRLPAGSPPVAILPSGSANNIARALGITGPHRDWIAQWPQARASPFERPSVRIGRRERRFIEAVGLGVFPRVIAAPDAESASGEAKVAYGADALLRHLQQARASRWRIEIDDVVFETRALMLEVLNVPLIGPRLNLSPGMAPACGQVDVAWVAEERRAELVEYLRHPAGAREAPFAVYRGRRVVIEAGGAPLHVDDELWPKPIGRHARVEVHAGGSPVAVLRPPATAVPAAAGRGGMA
jgi:diacylglycerol kinase (ATP)